MSNLRAMFPDVSQQAAEEALRNSNNDVNRGMFTLFERVALRSKADLGLPKAVEQVLVSRQS